MSRLNQVFSSIAKVTAGLGIAAAAFSNCIYTVPPGHRAVMFNRVSGVEKTTKGEGAHLMVPVYQWPIIMDVRTMPRTISSATGTKDLQSVSLSLRVLSRPNIVSLPNIYSTLGENFNERVLPSIGNEVLKAVVAKFNADELLTLRERVSAEIKEAMMERGSKFGLILDDVSITHLAFSPEFSKAIEQKQVAEQMAERAKFIVAKAEQEKAALLARSEGDAQAAQLVSDAIVQSGRGLIELRRVETAVEIAHSLAKNKNITYIPNNQGLLLTLDGKPGHTVSNQSS
jgi:prohibitin 1